MLCQALTTLLLASFTSASIPTISGWNLGFNDDFVGAKGASPDSSKWIIDQGTKYPTGPDHWGTGEVETYLTRSANVGLSGTGQLLITPVKSAYGWTSGRVETKSAAFNTPAGQKMRVEASIAMPFVTTTNGLGYWPAFFALGAPLRSNYSGWPLSGEWDIMENVNGINYVNQGLHCGTNPAGPCNEPSGIATSGTCVGSACQGSFHTYTAIVDRSVSPETITFSVDGVTTRQVKQTDMSSDYWSMAVHRGSFLILNVAMGGAYPNYVAGTTTPTAQTVSGVPMRVDYVGIWHA